MADFRLTQSGEEVQEILNNSTPQTSLEAETARAQEAEGQLQTNIESEASARQEGDAALAKAIGTERNRAESAEQTLANGIGAERSRATGAEEELQGNIDEEAAARQQAVANEAQARQTADTNLQRNIDTEETARIADVNEEEARAKAAENVLQQGISAETLARQQADNTLQSNINGERSRAEGAEQALGTRVTTIEGMVPSDASAQNKLATEGFVNSSVATNTATFKGSFNEVSDLHLTTTATRAEIAAELGSVITEADSNDYAFVQIPTDAQTSTEIARVERYKFNGTAWAFEYELNNSGFTSAQWEAINSAITSGLVAKLSALPTNAELTTLLNGKQAVIDDLAAIRSGAQAGAAAAPQASTYTKTEVDGLVAQKYTKPVGGIPETDLSTELRLELASFITATAQNLAYYYLKSETYSATQIDQMLAAIRQFQYEAVQTLPTPSAQTVGKIYLVPSADPQTQNTKDEYITLTTVEEGTTTYSWEKIGSTTIDLSNYYTKAQTDAAITAALNTALASYSTTAQVGTMISAAINSALQAYATKEYVSSQVQEYAGTFRGTYDTLAELEVTTGNHHNDYAWVKVTDSDGDNDYDRYKFNGTAWVFEYRLNNTHFTTDELAAIRSGMTTAKREKLDNLPATTSSSIAATTGAATISGSKQFFVGTQGQDGRWTLESLTPAEMQKCAYAYLSGATVGNNPAHLQGTDASGNPQRITPSDLASLLGGDINKLGLSFGGRLENVDLNTEDRMGVFMLYGATNFPGIYSYGLFVNCNIAQLFIPMALAGESGYNLYFRSKEGWGGSESWSGWKKVTGTDV